VEVEVADGALRGLTGGRIEVPVRSLRSGNPVEDAELQRRIDARRFPSIVGEMRKVTALGDDGRFRVEGDLSFHGVTRAIDGKLLVRREGDRLQVEGEQVFDVRDFGIKPPRILMLRVEPEVRVEIRLVAEAERL
jgi:polyisoprenoid-binding protein YceI